MLFAGIAGTAAVSDDSDADWTPVSSISFLMDGKQVTSYRVSSDEDVTVTLKFTEHAPGAEEGLTVRYTASLLNDSGSTVAGGVENSSGGINMKDGVGTAELTVKNQSTSGTYTLKVSVTETDDSDAQTFDHTAELPITMEFVTLSMTLKNVGSVDISGMTVYWFFDGQKIEGSSTSVDVKAGGTATISYKYFGEVPSGTHTYYVQSDSGNTSVEGIGEDNAQTFYKNQGNYDYLNYILGIILVLVIVLCIWVFRKPVKNYGKPKARR